MQLIFKSMIIAFAALCLEARAMEEAPSPDTDIYFRLLAQHLEVHKKKIAHAGTCEFEGRTISPRVTTTTITYTPKGSYIGAERWVITMQNRKLGEINHIKFNNKTRGRVKTIATDRSDIFITLLTKIKFDSDRCEDAPPIWAIKKDGNKLEVAANLANEETDLTIEYPQAIYYDVTFEYPDGMCRKAVRPN